MTALIFEAVMIVCAVMAAMLEIFFSDNGYTGYPDVWKSETARVLHDICIVIMIFALIAAAVTGIFFGR